jgi:phosphoglycolate phosphatase
MSFKGVIFDLDGTLLDTLEDLADAANGMLAIHGYPTHAIDAYRYFVGDGMNMLVTRAVPEDQRDDGTLEKCLVTMKREYQRCLNVKTEPYAGIDPMLAELKASQIPLAVLTNKPTPFATQCIERFFPGNLFDQVIGQHDRLPKKPDPAGALRIAAEWGVAPSEIVYVGDTSTDMETAVRAGMLPVGVLWGFRTGEELEQHGAKRLISSPMDLIPVVKQTV